MFLGLLTSHLASSSLVFVCLVWYLWLQWEASIECSLNNWENAVFSPETALLNFIKPQSRSIGSYYFKVHFLFQKVMGWFTYYPVTQVYRLPFYFFYITATLSESKLFFNWWIFHAIHFPHPRPVYVNQQKYNREHRMGVMEGLR